MTKEEIIKETVKITKRHLASKDYKILIFGSWAKGNALETSDIDIGILGKKEIPWSIMVKILEEVEEIPTLRKIDIVDFNAVDDNFKKNALNSAKILDYAGNF